MAHANYTANLLHCLRLHGVAVERTIPNYPRKRGSARKNNRLLRVGGEMRLFRKKPRTIRQFVTVDEILVGGRSYDLTQLDARVVILANDERYVLWPGDTLELKTEAPPK